MRRDEAARWIYKAAIAHSLALGRLEIIEKGAIGINATGRIVFLLDLEKDDLADFSDGIVVDLGRRLIIPGFIDGHFHAPQYSFVGTGMELPLLDWLKTYTFPNESRFSDPIYASLQYDTVIRRLISNGTTTCSYFATIHLESTKRLVDIVQKYGQRAMVGKVNMDRNAPDYLCETTAQSLSDTEQFVAHVLSLQDPLVAPVLTPRFVGSTTSALMNGLAAISHAHDPPIRVQSHVSENLAEVDWMKSLHPEADNYTDIYAKHGLLHKRTYMAHCVWCTNQERALLLDKGTGVIHCPNSNFSLSSGILNVRRMLDAGMKVGLGTDVSGGYSPSILDAIRQAINASKMVSIGLGSDGDPQTGENPQYPALTYAEAFHLATVGGAECLNIDDVVGNFLVGKEFDALVINPKVQGSPFDVHDGMTSSEVLQRFLFLGDDRNIEQVFVKGQERKTF
ncbi:hypothetical protein HDU83_000818 [Entophlyctis luteolus]|nr:hypothetical protein HDU82_001342 [Entophlyctis luteolus]KAJ3349041.1 hypothetical protein HDU83_000818 [Entophlyctis luteolus]KAJ3391005.1 hypothetical protein HDU84_006677 [Entophlyctis sp. JEL0112]